MEPDSVLWAEMRAATDQEFLQRLDELVRCGNSYYILLPQLAIDRVRGLAGFKSFNAWADQRDKRRIRTSRSFIRARLKRAKERLCPPPICSDRDKLNNFALATNLIKKRDQQGSIYLHPAQVEFVFDLAEMDRPYAYKSGLYMSAHWLWQVYQFACFNVEYRSWSQEMRNQFDAEVIKFYRGRTNGMYHSARIQMGPANYMRQLYRLANHPPVSNYFEQERSAGFIRQLLSKIPRHIKETPMNCCTNTTGIEFTMPFEFTIISNKAFGRNIPAGSIVRCTPQQYGHFTYLLGYNSHYNYFQTLEPRVIGESRQPQIIDVR